MRLAPFPPGAWAMSGTRAFAGGGPGPGRAGPGRPWREGSCRRPVAILHSALVSSCLWAPGPPRGQGRARRGAAGPPAWGPRPPPPAPPAACGARGREGPLPHLSCGREGREGREAGALFWRGALPCPAPPRACPREARGPRTGAEAGSSRSASAWRGARPLAAMTSAIRRGWGRFTSSSEQRAGGPAGAGPPRAEVNAAFLRAGAGGSAAPTPGPLSSPEPQLPSCRITLGLAPAHGVAASRAAPRRRRSTPLQERVGLGAAAPTARWRAALGQASSCSLVPMHLAGPCAGAQAPLAGPAATGVLCQLPWSTRACWRPPHGGAAGPRPGPAVHAGQAGSPAPHFRPPLRPWAQDLTPPPGRPPSRSSAECCALACGPGAGVAAPEAPQSPEAPPPAEPGAWGPVVRKTPGGPVVLLLPVILGKWPQGAGRGCGRGSVHGG